MTGSQWQSVSGSSLCLQSVAAASGRQSVAGSQWQAVSGRQSVAALSGNNQWQAVSSKRTWQHVTDSRHRRQREAHVPTRLRACPTRPPVRRTQTRRGAQHLVAEFAVFRQRRGTGQHRRCLLVVTLLGEEDREVVHLSNASRTKEPWQVRY